MTTTAELTQHIRFALLHLYEISVLDEGPARALAPWIAQVTGAPDNAPDNAPAGQQLHHLLVRAIEEMKPHGAPNAGLPPHRTYLILKRRYIDRVPIPQLEAEFSTSNRQFRRDNHRAVEELVLALGRLPVRGAEPTAGSDAGTVADRAELTPFSRTIGPVEVWSVVTEASKTLASVISSARITIRTNVQPDLPLADADRAALRLGIIKLLWLAISHCPSGTLSLDLAAQDDRVALGLAGVSGIRADDAMFDEASRLFDLAGGRLGVRPAGEAQTLAAELPRHQRPVVMVIDDDPAMHRIIERYLALRPVQVVSCRSTDDVLGNARKTRPALILLDILMPKRDGWEVLQELKADPETYHLNLAVCSIWDERDLALTLGADAFFQKPIDRAALLDYVEAFIGSESVGG